MLIRHYAFGRRYLIEGPPGTKVIRQSHLTNSSGGFLSDMLIIPWQGQEIPVFAEPDNLLSELARAGKYGLKLKAESYADTPPTACR